MRGFIQGAPFNEDIFLDEPAANQVENQEKVSEEVEEVFESTSEEEAQPEDQEQEKLVPMMEEWQLKDSLNLAESLKKFSQGLLLPWRRRRTLFSMLITSHGISSILREPSNHQATRVTFPEVILGLK